MLALVARVGHVPRFGLFHGIHALGRSGHPVLAVLLAVVVVAAIVMAARSQRRR